uniref:uncharacterized protein LOC120345014 n=1 Tax=Styela clava TaxID=7725 RepID=UPI00193A38B1|nr:uncharacterized protein LOC120345014 [Styela clava]
MEHLLAAFLALIYVTTISGNPPYNPGSMLGLEEDATEFHEQRKLEETKEYEEENEIDPRLTQQYSENSIGPYECSTHIQCVNDGTCVTTGSGKICNCSSEYLGPYCDYSASSIDKALRVHPLFKVSFAECMTKAGKTAGINALGLLEKCGGGQNMCWLHEGGVKGLKCFFWCLTNGMRLSLTEAKPSEESRLSLYKEVFQKFSRERHLPEKPKQHRPRGVPVASLQINLYDTSNQDYPYPKHGTFGLPEISIKPSVSFWTPNYKPDTYVPKGQPYGSPYASEKGRDPIYEPLPSEENPFRYPKSHEITASEPSDDNDEMGSVDEKGLNNFIWEVHTYGTEDSHEDQHKDSQKEEPPLEEAPGNNFLNDAVHDVMLDIYDSNVVEASDDNDDIVDDTEFVSSPYDGPFPYHDESSNMREGPPTE